MSDENTLKEFLVALGFKVDESSFKKFGEGVGGATKAVATLGIAVAATAVATETFVTKMAASLDRLYFATQRTGASASDIGDFQLAIQKLGGSADGALSSLEAVARFRRTTPGADGLLESWGVSAKDIGNAEKTLEDLAVHFRQIPEALAYKEGGILGIDEKTLLAMLNPDFHVGNDVADIYSKFGVNQKQALDGAHDFENQLHTMVSEFGAYGTWIESELIGPFARLNQGILDTMTSFKEFVAAEEGKGWHEVLGDAGQASKSWLSRIGDVLLTGENTIDEAAGRTATEAGLPAWMVHGFGWKTPDDVANHPFQDYAGNGAMDSNRRRVLAGLMGMGLSPAAAAGAVGNLQQESGIGTAGNMNANPAHQGLAQWDSYRQAQFYRANGHSIANSTLEEQIAFMGQELNSPRFAGLKDALNSAGTPAEAASIWQNRFEVAPGQDTIARGMYAGNAYQTAKDIQVNSSPNITVNGAGDPHATASAVVGAQKDAFNHLIGELTRNFGGAQ